MSPRRISQRKATPADAAVGGQGVAAGAVTVREGGDAMTTVLKDRKLLGGRL
jgi:hypothetical protein